MDSYDLEELEERAKVIFLEELDASGVKCNPRSVQVIPLRSVGVMGDERTYEYPIVIKMLRDGKIVYEPEFLDKVGSRIINEVPGINRVAYFLGSRDKNEYETDIELKELRERKNTSQDCFSYNLKKYMEKI